MNKRIIAIAIASVFSAGGAVAGGGGYMGGSGGAGTPPQGQSGMHGQTMSQSQFRNIDANNDGYISEQEVQAHEWLTEQLAEDWEEVDVNDDGRVDEAEFAAYEQEQLAEERRREMERRYRRPGDRID